jgi:hypothetical protein
LLIFNYFTNEPKSSFIWRGPVSFLKNLAKTRKADDPISIYDWKKKRDDEGQTTIEDFSDAIDLSETIESIISKHQGTVKFDKKQLGHIMLLIISSLKIVQLATLEEIVYLLKGYGIHADQKTVKQNLSLLKSLGLIVLKPYRNYEFYLAAPQSSWISWGYKTKIARNRDADRWSSQFLEFYDNNQKEKQRALRSYLQATGQIGD